MNIARPLFLTLLLMITGIVFFAAGQQGRADPAVLMATQREAMKVLSSLDGTWRGTAWTILPNGEKHTLTHTERAGSFLGGTVKVIEGRGYEPDGRVSFNAFATISFNPGTKVYTIHSYANGYVGDYVLTPTPDGYIWEMPAGPMTIRYTATIKDGIWREVGDRIMPGKDPVRFLELDVKRIGDSKWPEEGAVPAK
ncbi:MAG TPA: hypothetical protein VJS64_07260 [Pyrinomonadaceae bacterium]|nr:hypothetical protein [Pyrinomonadaceae bacterium]